MVDYEAQAEAFLRKKPRRIIDSQALQVFLMICGVLGPLVFAGVVFRVFFSYPGLINLTVALWAVASVVYSVYYVYVRIDEKKREGC